MAHLNRRGRKQKTNLPKSNVTHTITPIAEIKDSTRRLFSGTSKSAFGYQPELEKIKENNTYTNCNNQQVLYLSNDDCDALEYPNDTNQVNSYDKWLQFNARHKGISVDNIDLNIFTHEAYEAWVERNI